MWTFPTKYKPVLCIQSTIQSVVGWLAESTDVETADPEGRLRRYTGIFTCEEGQCSWPHAAQGLTGLYPARLSYLNITNVIMNITHGDCFDCFSPQENHFFLSGILRVQKSILGRMEPGKKKKKSHRVNCGVCSVRLKISASMVKTQNDFFLITLPLSEGKQPPGMEIVSTEGLAWEAGASAGIMI